MKTANFSELKSMSMADFSARSIRLSGVKAADFTALREWCEENFSEEHLPAISANEEKHGRWTVRVSFLHGDSVKNASLFRMFWDH